MNGAVYISFFQGQLESVLEQVVQLAVQELSKTVGSSLNGLLLETAVKEQENRRLRLQVQARESDGPGPQGAPGAPKNKASDERHEPGAHSSDRGFTDTRRLEQRGRVVDQLKGVMQRVLDFAVGELTKIVEASFDDLLLEIVKMEREQQSLEERLGLGASGGATRSHAPTRRRGSENDSVSPSGSEDNREEGADKDTHSHAEPRASELTSAQDWVPILDKVFGQKWCGDWSSERLEGGPQSGENQGTGLMEPRPSSPQQDPRWTPLEDMEVFSPDEDEDTTPVTAATTTTPVTTTTTTTSTGSTPTAPPGGTVGVAPPGGSARRSSASMLHRLLTLPSQLLEEDDRDDNNDIETLVVSMTTGDAAAVAADTGRAPSPPATREEDEEDEEEEEEEGDKRKKKRRRVWTECEDCGRRFSRVSLLKAHRQTHVEASPPAGGDDHTSALSCSDCGKRFSSNTRLQSHVRTNHGEKQA